MNATNAARAALLAVAATSVLAACTSQAAPRPVDATPTPPPTSPSTGPQVPTGPLAPTFDKSNFVSVIDNPYYPLKPRMKWVYDGTRDGVRQRDVVTVTDRTKVIDGVSTTVVTDVATAGGKVLEKTEDWFAQDRDGNVWYMGEATAAYDNGAVDTSGSWTAGVNGGQPGIIMPSKPAVTDSYRQEFLAGEAEDTSWIIDTGLKVTVPYGTVTSAIRSLEYTRLEPDVVDTKVYAPGIGIVREASIAGPKETADLISFTKS